MGEGMRVESSGEEGIGEESRRGGEASGLRSGENRRRDGMGERTRVESSGEEGIGEESR